MQRVGNRRRRSCGNKSDAADLIVIPLGCSLVGQQHPIRIASDTIAAGLYDSTETSEPFSCDYGLDPSYRNALERAGLRFSGFDAEGEPCIVELPFAPLLSRHRFPAASPIEARFTPSAASWIDQRMSRTRTLAGETVTEVIGPGSRAPASQIAPDIGEAAAARSSRDNYAAD